MSRRAHLSPSDDRRWVFNRLAEDYRARPPYPAALADRLAALAGGPGARVADLGAGAGHLAIPLAARGLRVAAVEPARAMLAELVRAARAASVEVEPIHAAAESTGLAARSFALVLVADALQWIDPEAGAAEVRRLLAPGGALAVVTARPVGTPFLAALSARIAAANPRARPGPPPVELFFSLAGLATPAREELADEEVSLTPDALDAVLRSLSYVGPALGLGERRPSLAGPERAGGSGGPTVSAPPTRSRLEALLAEARALAAEHGGAAWRRELRLWWARARP